MAQVFDHPWLSGLLSDPQMAALWSGSAQVQHMLAVEAAWSRAAPLAGLWSVEAGEAAARAIETAQIAPEDLAAGTGRDGVCLPDLVARLRDGAGAALHRGLTSQDVIDTATVLSLQASLDLLDQRLITLEAALADLAEQFGARPLMGRTRMQAAVPITVADRLDTWRLPLADHRTRLVQMRPRVTKVQIGGAAGDRHALGDQGAIVAQAMAEALGLAPADRAWHAMRDGIGEFGSALSLISGSLGKMGQDICLMAQQGLDEIALRGGGGSSAMPHKQNPVLAELLVTLARYNAAQLAGLHQAMLHEQERSGAAWTLEWMILPQMAQATGRGLVAATDLARSVTRIGG